MIIYDSNPSKFPARTTARLLDGNRISPGVTCETPAAAPHTPHGRLTLQSYHSGEQENEGEQ